jgi:hypothetical protein
MSKWGESKIWWDKKEKIVRALAVGSFDEKTARWVLQETQKMADKHGDRISWLIDLNRMIQATSAARKILAQASRHPSIRRYTFFGASIFIRTVANFVLAAAGQKNARHFNSESEALQWIKKGD